MTLQMLIWMTGCDEHLEVFHVGHFCLKPPLEMLAHEEWEELSANPPAGV